MGEDSSRKTSRSLKVAHAPECHPFQYYVLHFGHSCGDNSELAILVAASWSK